MDAAIIINPVAGSRRRLSIARKVELANEVLEACDLHGEVAVTTHQGHAADLARRFADEGVETVVAWGGDGTMNEVATELAFGGPALGIVPSGSGNGLARELNVPRQPKQALTTALTGVTTDIDAGELEGRLFFNVAGIGFDAHLASLFNALTTRGGPRYVAATVRSIWDYEPSFYRLRSSEVAISQSALIIALANSRQYGLNAQIAPLARPDDGLLELVVVPPMSPLSVLWHARRLFSGTLHQVPGVTMQSFRELEVTSDALPVFHVDGEVFEATDALTARVHPHAIQVRAEARAASVPAAR